MGRLRWESQRDVRRAVAGRLSNPLATRVAWVRDLFERSDVDSRDQKAVARRPG